VADESGQVEPEAFKLEQKSFDYGNSSGRVQILGVVAHELGHWANNDFIRNMVMTIVEVYVIFFAFGYSLKYTDMPKAFGFEN